MTDVLNQTYSSMSRTTSLGEPVVFSADDVDHRALAIMVPEGNRPWIRNLDSRIARMAKEANVIIQIIPVKN